MTSRRKPAGGARRTAAHGAHSLAFSDPGRLPPPPRHAIGFPRRDRSFDVLPGFVKPPPGYGEVPFYWWMGDPLTKERLAWQIRRLKDRGVAGLQVNYAHSDKGGRLWGLSYPSDPPLFSEAWWKLYGWFLREAKKHGMAVSLSDYTLGMGQGSYVDEIIADDPQLRGATLQHSAGEHDGGAEVRVELASGTLAVTAYRMKDGAIEPGSGVDLRRFVTGRALRWPAPAGRWQIVSVAPVANEFSIDPMHPLSGRKYIEKFFQRFEDRNPGEGGRGLNFFFSDELNFGVSGNLWTEAFAGEFHRRKGYDIVPELAALFVDVGPRTPKVRLDYMDVLVALEEEHFFEPIFRWHYDRGMTFGCDHGGRGRDVGEFGDYFRTQRWMTGPGNDQPCLQADVIKNKVASSIAHLYERPRTWLEGYHSSGWGTTSGQVVDATFRNFISGHNLLTLHGLYYSTHGGWWEWAPPCNHFRMPYWEHLVEFLRCSERLSYLLSQGHHRCDVAVLYPVEPAQAAMEGHAAVETAFGVGDHLFRKGIDFDFMDFQSLERARIKDRELRVAGEAYRVLVLPAMRAVRHSTLQKAVAFHRAGGIVIAVGALPQASDRVGRGDPEVEAMVQEIFGASGEPVVCRSPAGGSGVLAHDAAGVEAFVARAFTRDFAGSSGEPQVLHRRVGRRDIYMVYGAPLGSDCFFRAHGKVELWDAWSGGTRPLSVLSQDGEGTRLCMPLDANEAQIIVFSPGTPRADTLTSRSAEVRSVLLDGDWEFELQPTMDNTWGDFRWPPTRTMIGAEARRLRYADETAAAPGWHEPGLDDSGWPTILCDFGPRFWKLGPVPEGADATALEAGLAALTSVDPAIPVMFGGKEYRWQPYSFSWRWSVESDAGHQGYHGLKEEVHDEFIMLGRLDPGWKDPSYHKEDAGSRCYLWTAVATRRPVLARTLVGGLKPSAAWINGVRSDAGIAAGSIRLRAGPNPLLLRYDDVGRGYIVFEDAGADSEPLKSLVARAGVLATNWHERKGLLPFDARPDVAYPAGWYRFTSPPGLRSMTIVARGSVKAWADGRAMRISRGRKRRDGAVVCRAKASKPSARPVKVAIRIAQERGCYGGASLPEPVVLHCGKGAAAAGDWTQVSGLESYSGGAWYRRTVNLPAGRAGRRVILDMGNVACSAEVRVNGKPAGTRPSPPWTVDVTKFVRPGANRIEILVCNTLANHYSTIPTRYRGATVSGLLGPVRLIITDA